MSNLRKTSYVRRRRIAWLVTGQPMLQHWPHLSCLAYRIMDDLVIVLKPMVTQLGIAHGLRNPHWIRLLNRRIVVTNSLLVDHEKWNDSRWTVRSCSNRLEHLFESLSHPIAFANDTLLEDFPIPSAPRCFSFKRWERLSVV